MSSPSGAAKVKAERLYKTIMMYYYNPELLPPKYYPARKVRAHNIPMIISCTSIMMRELAREQRIVAVRLEIPDRPGVLGDITTQRVDAIVNAAKEKTLTVPSSADFESSPAVGVRARVDGRVVQVGGPYMLEQEHASELPVADEWRREGAIILHVLVDGQVAERRHKLCLQGFEAFGLGHDVANAIQQLTHRGRSFERQAFGLGVGNGGGRGHGGR